MENPKKRRKQSTQCCLSQTLFPNLPEVLECEIVSYCTVKSVLLGLLVACRSFRQRFFQSKKWEIEIPARWFQLSVLRNLRKALPFVSIRKFTLNTACIPAFSHLQKEWKFATVTNLKVCFRLICQISKDLKASMIASFPAARNVSLCGLAWHSVRRAEPWFAELRKLQNLDSIAIKFIAHRDPARKGWEECLKGLPITSVNLPYGTPHFLLALRSLPLKHLHISLDLRKSSELVLDSLGSLLGSLKLQTLQTPLFIPAFISSSLCLRSLSLSTRSAESHVPHLYVCSSLSQLMLSGQAIRQAKFNYFPSLTSLVLWGVSPRLFKELDFSSWVRIRVLTLGFAILSSPSDQKGLWGVLFRSLTLQTLKVQPQGFLPSLLCADLKVLEPAQNRSRFTLQRLEFYHIISDVELLGLCHCFPKLNVLRVQCKPQQELPVQEVELQDDFPLFDFDLESALTGCC